MLVPPSLKGQWQESYLLEMLTDWLRREELETEFLELRSKMRDIYLSWNVSSCDEVG
jgi:hypothetical protein